MGFEASAAVSQFHEALICPICPKLFVESLWSLIAHINASHRDNPLVLDYHSLQRLKKIVPKSAVCVIRPAFTADGNRSEFLNFFAANETIGNSMTSELKESEASLLRTQAFQEASESKSVSPEPISLDLSLPRKSTSPLPQPPLLKSPSFSISSSSPKETVITQIASSSTTSSTSTNTATVTGGGNKRVKRHSPYPRATKKQLCQKCGELFDNRCLLTLHMMVHKRQTHPYQCPINGCFQLYDSKMKFRSHLNRVHRELTPVKMETIIKEAAKVGSGSGNSVTNDEINNGFEWPTFKENNNNFGKTSTEQLAETVEKVIIKQEIFDS